MKTYEQLSARGQALRLRRLAERVLAAYGLADAKLTFLQNGENATFRVDASPSPSARRAPVDRSGRYVPNRYLLRIHNPCYKTGEKFASEMMWLEALRRDLDAPVPEPLRTRGGELCALVDSPGMGGVRACTMMRWLDGRLQWKRPRAEGLRALGVATARLHDHAEAWRPPSGFERKRWDWEGHFGANTSFDHPSDEVWAMIPADCLPLFREVSERARLAFEELERRDGPFRVVHGDPHLGNVVFAGGEARLFDFDDCGYAPWSHDFAVVKISLLVRCGKGQETEEGRRLWSSFLDGYGSVRTISDEQLRSLPAMEAVRGVTIAMWAASKARVNPDFVKYEGFFRERAVALARACVER